ncbi:MAG: N-acetyltransferase [Rhodoblastus sp.]|nr:N-acetyltransferase [Rhodoblastus sp.]
MSDVIDNQKENRFELSVDGSLAIAEYRISGDTIYFTHTETPWALQGRGIASALMRGALTSARERGLKVVARCSFVADYIAKHPEFQS